VAGVYERDVWYAGLLPTVDRLCGGCL
jgi:hypothetical protein